MSWISKIGQWVQSFGHVGELSLRDPLYGTVVLVNHAVLHVETLLSVIIHSCIHIFNARQLFEAMDAFTALTVAMVS